MLVLTITDLTRKHRCARYIADIAINHILNELEKYGQLGYMTRSNLESAVHEFIKVNYRWKRKMKTGIIDARRTLEYVPNISCIHDALRSIFKHPTHGFSFTSNDESDAVCYTHNHIVYMRFKPIHAPVVSITFTI